MPPGTVTARWRLGRHQRPAAWPSGLGKGLQSPVHRFDSGRRLKMGHELRNVILSILVGLSVIVLGMVVVVIAAGLAAR